jgi:DNA repair protein RadC
MTNLPRIKTSDDVLALVSDMASFEQEHLRILILNTKNRLLRIHEQYIGNLNGCNVRVGELFREAIRSNAAAIVLVHNHPSGEVLPSVEDVELTRGPVAAGRLLDIEVVDHVVVGTDGHFSLREQGLGFLTSRGGTS